MKPSEWARRSLDIAVAGVLLVATTPLLAVGAVGVRWRIGRPVLFRQPRSGLGGAPFEIFKLRTMSDPAPGRESPEFDAERLGRVGRWLRATSIDELPSLVNVLRGEMGLVGPRPLPEAYLSRYSTRQSQRLHVRPGVTGWAQVNGRNAVSWDERLEMDAWYVEHRSLRLDARIIGRTIATVLLRKGISDGTSATMHEFHGPGS